MRVLILLFFFVVWSSPILTQLIGGICDSDNLCDGRNGKCVLGSRYNTYWCRCNNGFGGEFCERQCSLNCTDDQKCVFSKRNRPYCTKKDELRNGSAFDDEDDDGTFVVNEVKRKCRRGSIETDCDKPTNPCESEPCVSGKCFPFNDGYQCICDNGYSGSNCEIGADHCLDHNCTNGSQCKNNKYGYSCDCPPGRYGQFCEMFECSLLPNICNRGSCILSSNSDKEFECACDDGFTGEFCNQDRNECAEASTPLCLNNGICRNTLGSYYCDCQRGFTGKDCNIPVDLCTNDTCANGGECQRPPNQIPVCSCRPGFFGERCEKRCPPGKAGVSCDLPLNKKHCSRTDGPCYNGGKCLDGFCQCRPSWTGDRCELNRKTTMSQSSCGRSPCKNNATCVDLNNDGGFACICKPGFYGEHCQSRADPCTPNPCDNGGKCQPTEYSLQCICPTGYTGDYCQTKKAYPCSSHPCLNGGVCKGGERGTCECPYGFTGAKCEIQFETEQVKKESFTESLCELRNCSLKAANNVCDTECNLKECNFDGGDCSGGQPDPFARCFYSTICSDLHGNGVCNQECNNEACLYDGLDCQPSRDRCPLGIRKHCQAVRNDGKCDKECSSAGCGYDGGDCANRTEALILNDIRIKLQMNPSEFQATGGDKLMSISATLQATVRIQKDEIGPLVFEWDGENETVRVDMDSTKLSEQSVLSKYTRKVRSTIVLGIVLYLEVEEICLPGTVCRFSTSQSVVDLLAMALTKTNGRESFGLPITEAIVASPRKHSGSANWSRNQILLITVIAFLAFGTVVAGVVVKTNDQERSRKRKIVSAPVWMPPLDPSVQKTNRNQSSSSSQLSLLDTNSYLNAPKRHRGDYQQEFGGTYDQIYPQTLANGFTGEFSQHIVNEPSEPLVNLPADQIPLHVQASGPDAITVPITKESVNLVDASYRRRVLHWLAANAAGKREDLITSETVLCLNAGAQVNARDCDENTALMLAVKARRVRLAVVLMRAGADPTIFNNSERSALHEAVANSDLRMMTNLLTDKRMLQQIDELDRNGMTALMMAARNCGDLQVDLAKLLLSKGAKIDADGVSRKDSDKYHGRTALHYAALCGSSDMVEFLMGRKSNKDKQDEAGRTPIMLAAREGREDIVRIFVMHGASLTAVDAMDKTAAQIASGNYHHELANYLTQVTLERNHKDSLRQMTISSNVGSVSSKNGRQTMKSIKRAGSRKTPSTGISSRESNHLTPPPSDGSFGSPSPHYFQTSTYTPHNLEFSPEHTYQSEVITANPMWYTTPPPYTDSKYCQIPPNQVYQHPGPVDNSFYC